MLTNPCPDFSKFFVSDLRCDEIPQILFLAQKDFKGQRQQSAKPNGTWNKYGAAPHPSHHNGFWYGDWDWDWAVSFPDVDWNFLLWIWVLSFGSFDACPAYSQFSFSMQLQYANFRHTHKQVTGRFTLDVGHPPNVHWPLAKVARCWSSGKKKHYSSSKEPAACCDEPESPQHSLATSSISGRATLGTLTQSHTARMTTATIYVFSHEPHKGKAHLSSKCCGSSLGLWYAGLFGLDVAATSTVWFPVEWRVRHMTWSAFFSC